MRIAPSTPQGRVKATHGMDTGLDCSSGSRRRRHRIGGRRAESGCIGREVPEIPARGRCNPALDPIISNRSDIGRVHREGRQRRVRDGPCAREAAAVHRSSGGLLRSRAAVRAHAAAGGRWRRLAFLSGSGSAGSCLDRRGGARPLRKGTGHAGGHLGPRLLADRFHAGSTVRQGVAGYARGDSGRGGGGPRLPERPAGCAALQAAHLRNGRLLLAAPRHRESRRDDRDSVHLVGPPLAPAAS